MSSIFSAARRTRALAILGPLIFIALTLSFFYHPQQIPSKASLLQAVGLDHQSVEQEEPPAPLLRKDQRPLGAHANSTRKLWQGTGNANGTKFVFQTEVEDVDRDAEDDEEGEEGAAAEEDDGYDFNVTTVVDRGDYRELFSLTTRDRKFIPIHMDGLKNWNPNVIPHPTKADEWMVVAAAPGEGSVGAELFCSAGFLNDVLVCAHEPRPVSLAKSIVGKCEGEHAFFNARQGPRDARLFHGIDTPYLIYGTQSTYTCLGSWLQDARPLLEPFHIEQAIGNKLFRDAKEIMRPEPWSPVERNFFLFWDIKGKVYAHHEIYPKRVFAALDYDGSVSEDLAPKAARSDKFCMAQYMPVPLTKDSTMQQATNSLWITLCKRADPGCSANENNTFIMHIFQFKTDHMVRGFYDYTTYEPYVMLMKRTAPFAIHAIGQKPLWIAGRDPVKSIASKEKEKKRDGHEMLYVTSMSWKFHGQKHHGYIDDPILIGFGIDDARSAIIDIKAEDLIVDLAFCD